MSNPATGYPAGYPAGYHPRGRDENVVCSGQMVVFGISGVSFGTDLMGATTPNVESQPAQEVKVSLPFSMEKHIYGLPQDKPWPKIGDTCCKCNGGKYLGLSDMFGTDLDCDACGHHVFVCAEGLCEDSPKVPRKRLGTGSTGSR